MEATERCYAPLGSCLTLTHQTRQKRLTKGPGADSPAYFASQSLCYPRVSSGLAFRHQTRLNGLPRGKQSSLFCPIVTMQCLGKLQPYSQVLHWSKKASQGLTLQLNMPLVTALRSGRLRPYSHALHYGKNASQGLRLKLIIPFVTMLLSGRLKRQTLDQPIKTTQGQTLQLILLHRQ